MNRAHHSGEEANFFLVFVLWVFLSIPTKVDTFAKLVHASKMIFPEGVNCLQKDNASNRQEACA